MPISFSYPNVRKFLVEHGHVYTIRKNPRRISRKTGIETTHATNNGNFYRPELTTWSVPVIVERIEDLDFKTDGNKISVESTQLKPYVKESGWKTAQEWASAYKVLQGDRMLGVALFKVSLRKAVSPGSVT